MLKRVLGCGMLVVLPFYGILAQIKYSTQDISLQGDVLAWYDSNIGFDNTQIQTGHHYEQVRLAQRGHPYYVSTAWTKGEITYRGSTYQNVDLLYDINADILLTRYYAGILNSAEPVQLIKTQISKFKIHQRTFILVEEKIDYIENSFFELLYESDSLQLLARRKKVVAQTAGEPSSYVDEHQFFLNKKGSIHKISRENAIYRVFPEDKKEIRGFIRKNQIKLSGLDFENSLVRVIDYCNNLIYP